MSLFRKYTTEFYVQKYPASVTAKATLYKEEMEHNGKSSVLYTSTGNYHIE